MRRISLGFLFLLVIPSAFAISEFGYVVKEKKASVYAEPSMESKVIDELGIATPISLAKVDSTKGEWLHHSPSSPDLKKGWVRRQDVANASDFKKVVGCWPFKEVDAPPDGEETYDKVVFTTKGKAKLISNEGRKWPADTYLAGELALVRVASNSKNAPFGEFFYLNLDAMTISPNGEPSSHEERFADEKLNGCHGITLK